MGRPIALLLKKIFQHSAKVWKPPVQSVQWKIARASAAFKKGREEDKACHRPLSMLSIPSKFMESCVTSNIIDHLVTRNLLDDRQWAYNKGKSTEQLEIQIKEKWTIAVDRKLLVGVLLVEFTKACDTVSHNILLQKLNDPGIRGDLWVWLSHYLTERRQFVRVDG